MMSLFVVQLGPKSNKLLRSLRSDMSSASFFFPPENFQSTHLTVWHWGNQNVSVNFKKKQWLSTLK